MRLLPALVGVFACAGFAVTPAIAGQRGPHATPTPTVHAAAPKPPATTAVRPAPVLGPHTTAVHAAHTTPTPTVHAAAPRQPATTAVHPSHVLLPQKIVNSPALVARLQPLVPSNMTLASAATGFRNQGQFIAALHVSQNLHIPFAALKSDMIGPHHDSLGQAIHVLQPSAKATIAARRADQEAANDLKATKPAKTTTGRGDR